MSGLQAALLKAVYCTGEVTAFQGVGIQSQPYSCQLELVGISEATFCSRYKALYTLLC